MKAFYKRLLAGDTAAAALKQAQAAVRKKDPQWQAPYYWAAWILVGDGWDSISQRQ
jgi:CHAT domain-containing protein